jgi:EmrB/QacA subfamily drug resistance transporter
MRMRALRAEQPATGRRRWTVLAVMSAAQFLIILDLWVVNIALPALQRDFAPASLADVSWILDAYAIVLAALLLPAGRAADRIGRRECFLAGLVVFGAASLGCALAPDLLALIACRALQAAGAAVLMPTSLGLALQVFPSHQRGTAVGIWAAVGAVAAGSGPVLGGLLVESSWRWIFLINLPVVLAALAAGVVILPRRPRLRDGQRPSRRTDDVGAGLVLGAVGLVCTALTEAPQWPPSRTWPVLAAGLVLGAAFVTRIRRHPDPLVAPQLFSVRAFRAGAAGLVAYYTGFAAMLLGTTLLLTAQWRFSVLQAAASIAPGPITAGIVSPFSGRLSARFGVRGTVVAGAVLFAAAGAWPLASAGDSPAYAAVVLPAMLLWGMANALIQPSLFACADAAPRAELASASAVLATARQLGSALGVAAFVAAAGGSTAGSLAGFDRAWIVVVISAAITAVAGLAAGRRIRVPEVTAKAEMAGHAAAIARGASPAGDGRDDC